MPWLEAVHAAWLRMGKLQKIDNIDATHTADPKAMRAALLAELNLNATTRPLAEVVATVTPMTEADRARAAAIVAAANAA